MFNGLGNLGNLASMVGKLKDMPEHMQQLRENLRQQQVTGTSACGHVVVTMNGLGEVQSVTIAPALMIEAGDPEKAAAASSTAVHEATNTAGAEAKSLLASSIRQLADDLDLNLPGMDGLLSSLTGV